MHTVFALLCFVVVIHWLIFPYPSGLLHWHCGNRASKATLMNMDKYFMWIHYERLHNHNKAKDNKTVCIFLGIYCICVRAIIEMSMHNSTNKCSKQRVDSLVAGVCYWFRLAGCWNEGGLLVLCDPNSQGNMLMCCCTQHIPTTLHTVRFASSLLWVVKSVGWNLINPITNCSITTPNESINSVYFSPFMLMGCQ